MYIWKSIKTRGRLLQGRVAVTPPSLPPELSAWLEAGLGTGRGAQSMLPLSRAGRGGSAGRRSLASAGIFRNICRLGFLAAGRCWLCRQPRLLKALLPPAVCCSPSPAAAESPGSDPEPAAAKASPGCPNRREEEPVLADAPQPPPVAHLYFGPRRWAHHGNRSSGPAVQHP